ncbi:MAG: hypothetical protein KF778_06515 [Rhodocyclaceae bacterium]|nr:hypothetical protein [Rhodocyclaceae bacterium]MBX3668039.1 hypothetical protein [Rhodocyclaceae bacterium]
MGDILILDHGRQLRLTYAGMLDYHGGSALAGAAIAWRAMEAAAHELSGEQPWDRHDLHLRIAHDGPGVRDAIEYVTRAITRGRLATDADTPQLGSCGSHRAFRFAIRGAERTIELQLRPGIVAPEFFATVQALRERPADPTLERQLEVWKQRVAVSVLQNPLADLFEVRALEHVSTQPMRWSA